jgi:hypothetical protein
MAARRLAAKKKKAGLILKTLSVALAAAAKRILKMKEISRKENINIGGNVKEGVMSGGIINDVISMCGVSINNGNIRKYCQLINIWRNVIKMANSIRGNEEIPSLLAAKILCNRQLMAG